MAVPRRTRFSVVSVICGGAAVSLRPYGPDLRRLGRWPDGPGSHQPGAGTRTVQREPPDGPHAAITGKGRVCGASARPLSKSSPPSSKSTMPLHNRLQPCSGWAAMTWAAERAVWPVDGHCGSWLHTIHLDLTAADPDSGSRRWLFSTAGPGRRVVQVHRASFPRCGITSILRLSAGAPHRLDDLSRLAVRLRSAGLPLSCLAVACTGQRHPAAADGPTRTTLIPARCAPPSRDRGTAREVRLSLRRMLARCRWTVCSLKKSRWACAARPARISRR
jgi:hypothetical protein